MSLSLDIGGDVDPDVERALSRVPWEMVFQKFSAAGIRTLCLQMVSCTEQVGWSEERRAVVLARAQVCHLGKRCQ